MTTRLLTAPGAKRGPGQVSVALLTADPEYVARVQRWLATDPHIRSPHTRSNYLLDLVAFDGYRKGRMITRLLAEEYAAYLLNEEKLSPLTVNRRLASIRWYARRASQFAVEDTSLPKTLRDELVLQAERAAAVEDVDVPARKKAGRHVSDGELAALLRACADDDSPAGVRDAAILALAWATGGRRASIAAAWLDDLKRIDASHLELTLHGKGNKEGTIYLAGGAAAALTDWMRLRGKSEGFIFCAILKDGSILLDHGLSTQALADMLAKRRAQAGVAHLTWHDFRRTFAGNLLDAGEDIATVQKLMMHASPVTTSNYDRRGEEVQRKALSKLHVPYTGRLLLPTRKVKK